MQSTFGAHSTSFCEHGGGGSFYGGELLQLLSYDFMAQRLGTGSTYPRGF
jgi:hypothetical protein